MNNGAQAATLHVAHKTIPTSRGIHEPHRRAAAGQLTFFVRAFRWYRDIDKQQRRTFWSCKIGYGLDGMDTQMLSFVIPTLIMLWGITTTEAGLIHTSTLIASAVGGWVAGILSDRIGRVRTLQLTVLWFAFFTFLCGFAQNYEQLLIARTLMGFGFGGEWTAGAVLIGEVIRAQDRGKAVGMVQSGWAIGWGLTAILYALLFSCCRQSRPGVHCSCWGWCRRSS